MILSHFIFNSLLLSPFLPFLVADEKSLKLVKQYEKLKASGPAKVLNKIKSKRMRNVAKVLFYYQYIFQIYRLKYNDIKYTMSYCQTQARKPHRNLTILPTDSFLRPLA